MYVCFYCMFPLFLIVSCIFYSLFCTTCTIFIINNYSFLSDVRQRTKHLKSHERRVAVSVICAWKLLKKNRMLSSLHRDTGLRRRNHGHQKLNMNKQRFRIAHTKRKVVETFFQREDVSRATAGKKRQWHVVVGRWRNRNVFCYIQWVNCINGFVHFIQTWSCPAQCSHGSNHSGCLDLAYRIERHMSVPASRKCEAASWEAETAKGYTAVYTGGCNKTYCVQSWCEKEGMYDKWM